MAHVFNLVYGSTTIDLTSGDYRLEDYVNRTGDGNTVNETAKVEVSDTTVANLLGNIRAIEKIIAQASVYPESEIGNKVYVELQPSSASVKGRSQILIGKVSMPDNALKEAWANLKLTITITWTRVDFWEAASETELALTNGNGSAATGGINIYNCNDDVGTSPSKRNNYVEIAGASVEGDLPAPCKVLIDDGGFSGSFYEAFYALNTESDMGFVTLEEGEDALTPVVDANCSGGNYGSFSFGSLTWPLITVNLAGATGYQCNGNYLWVFMRARFPVSHQYKIELSFYDGAKTQVQALYYTPTDVGNFELINLGMIQAGSEYVAPGNVAVYITGGDAADDGYIDYIHVFPVNGWRRVNAFYLTVADDVDYILDDPSEGYVVARDGTTARGTLAMGPGIFLKPATTQRVMFSFQKADKTAAIALKFVVRLYYRARWRTL